MAVVLMRLLSGSVAPSAFITILVWFLLTKPFGSFAQTDVSCLRAIRSQLEDPMGNLGSWDFSNNTQTSLCKFAGIDCWHEDDNKILNIRLSDMGLKGEFPQGLSDCKSLTGLDLSRNSIRGNIPDNISMLIEFVTTLDLSSNQLSGEIPVALANCTYLNVLRLDSNQLTGQIPLQMNQLSRLKTFSVANNRLSGQVPTFGNANISAENYANNAGLCGGPLPPCRGRSKANRTRIHKY